MQKVLRIGNSLGATFPADFVARNGVKPGADLLIDHSNGSITFLTKIPKETKYEVVSDNEFFKLVKEVDLKYKKALDELARLP